MEPEKTEDAANQANKMEKKWIIAFLVIVGIVALTYGTIGLFVVQPIGAVPEGVTIVYFRAGLNLPFVSSPDSLGMTDDGKLSPMGRLAGMTAFMDAAEDRIIARLPYFEPLYERSTGGRRWDF